MIILEQLKFIQSKQLGKTMKKKVGIIGGGIFGISCALNLDKTHDVTLFEQTSDIMSGATYANHNRHHLGYHYPRSPETAQQCLESREEFETIYRTCCVSNFANYYCIAKENSKTSAKDYILFCDHVGLKYKEEWPAEGLVNRSKIELSLKTKEGVYDFPPHTQNGNYTKFTILKDGNRYSGKGTTNIKGDIIFLGGSFTQGWAVNDEETFSYLFQKKLADFRVKNYGVNAYGSFQSLLMLEEILKKNRNVKLVIYCYIWYHETRNYGNATWIQVLNKIKPLYHVALPYARLDKNNNLIRHKPIKYFKLPLREYSVLITKIEKKL